MPANSIGKDSEELVDYTNIYCVVHRTIETLSFYGVYLIAQMVSLRYIYAFTLLLKLFIVL